MYRTLIVDILLATWGLWGAANYLVIKGILPRTAFMWDILVFPVKSVLNSLLGVTLGDYLGAALMFVSPVALIALLIRIASRHSKKTSS